MDALMAEILAALKACETELEYVRVHCRDARGCDVIIALKQTRAAIALATEVAPPGDASQTATGTESARQTARTGSAGDGFTHPVD